MNPPEYRCPANGSTVRLAAMELLSTLASPLLAYLLIAGLVALDGVIPSVPADVVLIAAGTLSAVGTLVYGWVALAAVVGSVTGDQLSYRIGRHGLPGALSRMRTGQRVIRAIESSYRRLGPQQGTALVLARFVPFGRIAASLGAGIAGVPARRHVLASAAGAILWAAWLIGLGHTTGSVTNGPLWLQVLAGIAVGLAAGAVVAAVHRIRETRRRARMPAQTPAPVTEAEPICATQN